MFKGSVSRPQGYLGAVAVESPNHCYDSSSGTWVAKPPEQSQSYGTPSDYRAAIETSDTERTAIVDRQGALLVARVADTEQKTHEQIAGEPAAHQPTTHPLVWASLVAAMMLVWRYS